MKSPFFVFLPAAIGAVGMYIVIQPGRQESSLPKIDYVEEARSQYVPNPAPLISSNNGQEISVLEGESSFALPSGTITAFEGNNDTNAGEQLSKEELMQRAALVEKQADKELERLIPLLNLTPDQQDRIFNVLARNSPSFVPGMLVDNGNGNATELTGSTNDGADILTGEPGAAVAKDEVFDELDKTQQDEFIDVELDKIAWWDDVINYIEGSVDAPNLTLEAVKAPADATSTAEPRPDEVENNFVPGSIPF